MLNKKILKNELQDILSNKFWDKEFGGYYSATNNYNSAITLEKKIIDQVYVLLSAYLSKDNAIYNQTLTFIILWLENNQDNLVEIREQYDYPIDLGTFKTTSIWYQVSNILLYLGFKTENQKLIYLGNYISKILDKKAFQKEKGAYLSKLSSDWKFSVDGLLDNSTLILSTLNKLIVYSNNTKKINRSTLEKYLHLVEKIIVDENHIISVVNLDGSLSIDSKITLQDQSFLILLYKKLYEEFQEMRYLEKLNKIIKYTNDKFWDNKYSGYFSFIDSDGKIRIHKEFIVLLTPKTPAKYTFDNALFLMSVWNTEFQKSQQYKQAIQYLMTLRDEVNKGFFIAEGYFWAAPGIPVGPFLRSVSPSLDTAGVVYFGSTKFVHFSNKYPITQAMCLCLISQIGNKELKLEKKETKLNFDPHFVDINYNPITHPKVDLTKYIDVEKHLKWVESLYTKGQGFGWTPYESPLGVKANKTSAIFGTQHALANLKLLDGKIPDSKALAYWISLTQAENGAFAENPGEVSDILYTYLAINALSIIEMIDIIDKEKCIEYLQSCQNLDGGFGVNPGFKSDMFHSNLALATLYMLEVEPKSNKGIIEYTNSALKSDGGYSEYSIGTSDTYSCYRAISTYCMYGIELPQKEKTVKFLKSCQKENGGFAQDSEGTSSLIATYHAVAALYMLKSEPNEIEKCIQFLSDCQAPDGGIANIPGASTGTIDEGFAGIQSLAMLTNQLNKSYATIIS